MRNGNFRIPLIFLAVLAFSFLSLSSCSDKADDKKDEASRSGINQAEGTENGQEKPKYFLAYNASQPGVKTTDSGLQYKIIQKGSGRSPGPNDFAVVNYIGKHVDGQEFDNSYKRGKPTTVPVGGVIPGWSEALQMMKEGGQWEIYVPAKLAYGAKGVGDVIAPNETLIFDVEMVKVQTEKEIADLRLKKFKQRQAYKEMNEKFLSENLKNSDVKVTESGLQYIIEREGAGRAPTLEDTVKVDYRGTLIDGTEFDSSYSRGQPATFPVKGVIKGWTEALQMMRVGSKWKLFIPSDLAYGARGAGNLIKPYSTLIFEVELLSVQ